MISEAEACYWSGFVNDHYLYCEEQLCSFVVEPANTWTNIVYLIAAIAIWRSQSVTDRRVKNLFFAATASLFVGSTLFHMTGTYWGKILDVSAMFAVSMVTLSLAIERRWNLSERTTYMICAGGFALSVVFLLFAKYGFPMFVAEIAVATYLEWKMSGTPRGLDFSKVINALATLVAAFSFWLLDVTRILCRPSNHLLTGHGVWHLLAGMTIWVFFTSYAKKEKGNGPF